MSNNKPPIGSGLLPLSMLTPGTEATLVDVRGGAGVRRHLAEMGLVPGVRVRLLNGDIRGPVVVAVGDTRLMLGRGMAHKILVR